LGSPRGKRGGIFKVPRAPRTCTCACTPAVRYADEPPPPRERVRGDEACTCRSATRALSRATWSAAWSPACMRAAVVAPEYRPIPSLLST
jgi:hypothetical protein